MAALVLCALATRRSKRAIAPDVQRLLVALIPPMLGNLVIILSSNWLTSVIGCYIYYIGMDITTFMLLIFTFDYCSINLHKDVTLKAVAVVVGIDIVQLLLNPLTGHAFSTNLLLVDGTPYYALVPLVGQTFHRVVAYGLFFASLGIFVYKVISAPRVYVERYAIILLVMIVAGAWQSFYILSGTPIDQSMVGFGVFGLMIYYFSLLYRPVRLLDRMLARVVSEIGESVFFFDRDGRCIYANDAARDMYGIEADDDIEACSEMLADVVGDNGLEVGTNWSDDYSMQGADGELHWGLNFQTVADESGKDVGAFLNIRDRTEEVRQYQREKYYATHDRLTGLYNKEQLYEAAREMIDAHPETLYQAVAVDIKDFKLVNDIFNKEFGDQVLCAVADRLKEHATEHEVYGRITGDRFGFVLPADELDTEGIEERLRTQDFVGEGINHRISIHIGVYDITERALPLSVMFDRAFMAIQTIKNDFQRHMAFYDNKLRDDALWAQRITGELDQAIAEGQIRPYLQPMVDSNGKVEGAEVLVRWIHPEEGFLSPARFIPQFEESGLISKLDQHMWECACKILKDWERHGIDLFLSVNISPKDFYFLDVYETIRELVERYKVNPAKLRLEITETVMMSDLENRLRIIESLRGDGFLVEMDDFGSGYSSLNMLKDIPVDVLKIDMMFLYKTKDQQRAQTILQTIINLSSQLGIPSVTEGVETDEQLGMLVDMGCDMFQGYLFARPMPVEDFEADYC